MNENHVAAAILVFTLIVSICGIITVDCINKWEREAGYPYGRMRDVFPNCAR